MAFSFCWVFLQKNLTFFCFWEVQFLYFVWRKKRWSTGLAGGSFHLSFSIQGECFGRDSLLPCCHSSCWLMGFVDIGICWYGWEAICFWGIFWTMKKAWRQNQKNWAMIKSLFFQPRGPSLLYYIRNCFICLLRIGFSVISWKLSGEKNNSLTATVAAGNETNFFNNNHMQNYLHWTNDLEGAFRKWQKNPWQLSKATFQKNIENLIWKKHHQNQLSSFFC